MSMKTWYRIDKQNGAIAEVPFVTVSDRARDHFNEPADVIATGRFSTAFAIYVTEERLSDGERAELSTQIAGE